MTLLVLKVLRKQSSKALYNPILNVDDGIDSLAFLVLHVEWLTTL